MDKNKEMLTLEFIKKENNKFHKFVIISIPVVLLMIVFLILIDYVIMVFIPLVFLFVLIKNRKNLNKNIDNGDFKIIEDKIYDKYYICYESSNNFKYYICSKIYGDLLVSSVEYEKVQKDDSIYFLIYNYNNENYKIDGKYLARDYEIAEELKKYFIPYETLGEKNFDNRINDMINEKKEKNTNVICKSCGKEYKTNNQNVCPSCYSIYKYGIKDVVYQKEWY